MSFVETIVPILLIIWSILIGAFALIGLPIIAIYNYKKKKVGWAIFVFLVWLFLIFLVYSYWRIY
jgi:hypothetical protein